MGVNVTQQATGARASGWLQGECTGSPGVWEIATRLDRDSPRFEPGPATLCYRAMTGDPARGVQTDEDTACTAITLVVG